MNDWRTPRAGHYLRWRDVVWTIKVNVNGVLHLEDFETGETRRLPLADYQAGCFEGKVEMLESPTADIPEDRQALAEIAFNAMPQSMQRQVMRMRRYIEAYENPLRFYQTYLPTAPIEGRLAPDRMSAAKVEPFLKVVAGTFKLGEKASDNPDQPAAEVPPGFTTFAKWMRMWHRYRDWKLMAPRFDRRGSDDRSVIVGPVKKIVDTAIRQVWLTRARNTKTATCQAIEIGIKAYNDRHPNAPVAVSRRQVFRYIDQVVGKYETVVAREGKSRADSQFEPVLQGPEAKRIMEIVEVDHTRAKVEVTDDETGKNLGRPWITAAIDRRSRMVVGLHVHFEGSSIHAVMQCLRNLMAPKTFLKKLVPDIDYRHTACGIPERFLFDQGTDFDSDHVHEVCSEFTIVPFYTPGAHPEYKASIERFNGTMHGQVAFPLKGAMRRIADRRDDRDTWKNMPVMPFSDFVARLWHWVTMIYSKAFHTGLGGIPLEVWNECYEIKPPRPPWRKDKTDVLLMRTVRCEPTREGVAYNGLYWNGEVIKAIRSHPEHRRSQKILVRIDEGDLGLAYATNPVTGKFEKLDPVLTRYMPGKTMHQHNMAVLRLKKKQEGTHSELALMRAYKRHMDEARETHEKDSTKSKVRARLARDVNIGGTAPSGDDLGSLAPDSVTMAIPVGPVVETVDVVVEDVAAPDVATNPEPEAATPKARVSPPARKL
jgi:transposase InsO family protein